MYVVSAETGTTRSVIEVTLSDGSRFFVLDAVWRRSGLNQDHRCSVAQLEELQLQSEKTAVENKAVELLARREYSRYELALRLHRRGYGEHAVRAVLDDLGRRGLQDDARFARAWIESRLRRRPQAGAQLLLGLRAKGVASAIAAEALDEYEQANPDWHREALQRALERARRSANPDRQQLIAKLARLGFDLSMIRALLRREAEADSAGR